MREHRGMTFSNCFEPLTRSLRLSAALLVLPHRPLHKEAVDTGERSIQARLIEAPVVVDPASHGRVDRSCELIERSECAQMKLPTSNGLPNLFGRSVTDGRSESEEDLFFFILHSASTECESKKVERRDWVIPRAVSLLAEDYLRLFRMHLQLEELQPIDDV